jgi:ABC-2 type transport system ATP-binding protein
MVPLIQLENIVKTYGRITALDHVCLQFGPRITGLLGPNGAGKSTLIKMILGLVRAGGGSGDVLGHRLGVQGRQIRSLIGYLPEDDCYIPGLSGVEVVRFSATLAGMPPTEGLRRAHEILDFCGMQQERYRDIETYSSGMRQKIKFASAIVHDPRLLILDEPTSHLDPEEREDLLNRIRVLAQDFGKAVILCTHILRDVQTTCDEVVILYRGQVKLQQTMEELNRPSSPTTHIHYYGAGQDFGKLLTRAGIGVLEATEDNLQIQGTEQSVIDSVWRIAAEKGIVVQSITPARNSLEEVFMNTVREDTDAHQ